MSPSLPFRLGRVASLFGKALSCWAVPPWDSTSFMDCTNNSGVSVPGIAGTRAICDSTDRICRIRALNSVASAYGIWFGTADSVSAQVFADVVEEISDQMKEEKLGSLMARESYQASAGKSSHDLSRHCRVSDAEAVYDRSDFHRPHPRGNPLAPVLAGLHGEDCGPRLEHFGVKRSRASAAALARRCASGIMHPRFGNSRTMGGFRQLSEPPISFFYGNTCQPVSPSRW